MKNILISICCFLLLTNIFSQGLNGSDLLDKAIAYHDPIGNWNSFNGTLNITMVTSNNSNRETEVVINLPEEYFHSFSTRDSVTKGYTINKGKCIISKTDSLRIANETSKPKRSHCEMANLYKNYYTYLYGLPMKLKDKGTIINDNVEYKSFKGKNYLVLKATYEESVGSDVWYFYFNPETYAMEVYQFFKTDDTGVINQDSGEYILLTEEETIKSIKIPKIRAWYYNKDNKYLGTDILK